MANTARAIHTENGVPSIRFEKYKLANGLEVILAEDHRLPLIAFNVWYHVGPRNERPGLTGFAHLFEHLMFAGSKHIVRGEADKIVDGAGGTDNNGTTDFDRTNYFFTLPSNRLELGLWIKSDMMGYMIDEVDQVALANQQDVVRNERRQRIENQPYGIVEEAVFHSLFPKDHPYYASVMGSHADIQAANLGNVMNFSHTYYRPNNATLVLVGDFKKARAKQLIEKYFASLSAGDAIPAVNVAQPQIASERRKVVEDRVELPRLYLAWHTPPIFKPGDAEMDFAAFILAGGKSSRLYKTLVYDKQIAQSVTASQQSLSLGSVFLIEATARPGHTAEELENAIDEELAKLAAAPPSAAELARARNTYETRFFGGLEKVSGIADRLNAYNQQAGDPGYLQKDIARYRAIKPDDVMRAVSAQLGKSARVAIYGVPGKQDLGAEVPTPPAPGKSDPAERVSVNADQAWRSQQPKGDRALALALPAGKTFKLSNGLTVVHVANPGVPLVSATLVVRAGARANPAQRPGLASFTAAMLQEGTAKRSALELADDIAALGATFSTIASHDDTWLTLDSLKSNFPAALDILADVVMHPAFADAEIERQRKNRSAALVQQHESPLATAAVVAAAALYGADHPYGKSSLGSEDAIKATSREDLLAFWRSQYRPENAALVVSGNIGMHELKRIVTAKLAAWKAAAPLKEGALPQAKKSGARLVLVDKPDAPQTALRIVSFGPKGADKDVAGNTVMNAILGGNFTSRINHTLREVKGYTYGVYSRFAPERETGAFVISGSVRADATASAVEDIFKEIDGVRAKSAPLEEFDVARNSQLLSLPGLFDTNAEIAASTALAWSQDRGLDYYAKLPAKLIAVDAATALKLAQKYVVPGELVVVAVGDKAKIAPQFEKAGIVPIEVRDLDGNVVK